MTDPTDASRCQPPPPVAPVIPFPTPVKLSDPLPGILPACGISLLTGAPNVGKTALLASLACSFRDGTPIFGHQPNTLPGLGIISADRGWAIGAGVWFDRVGYPDIRVYSMPDDRSFDPRCLRKRFERTQRLAEFTDKLALPRGSLLLVDPLGLFLGGNLNDYDSCLVAAHEIRAMLRTKELTLLGTAHTAKLRADPKARYMRLQDQILGSTALLGFSDTQMYLASPEEIRQASYCFAWNSHSSPPEFFSLDRDAHGLFVPALGVESLSAARVLALLPEDGTAQTLAVLAHQASAIPLTERTVRRALDALIEEGHVVKVRRGVYRRAVT